MSLFNIARPGKESDSAIAKKSNSRSKAIATKSSDSLISRMEKAKALVEKNLSKYKDAYELVTSADRLQYHIDMCKKNRVYAIDTETEGLNPLQDIIAGFSIYTPNDKAIYVPLNHRSYITKQRVDGQIPIETASSIVSQLLNYPSTMFNSTFDIRVIRHWLGVDLDCEWDCALAAKLLNENESFTGRGLKALHAKYVLQGKEDAFSFEGYFKGIPFTEVPLQTGYLYAAHDAVVTFELRQFQEQYILSDREDMKGIANVFFNVEMPVVDVVADMEDTGVAIDDDVVVKLHKKYHDLYDKCLDKVNKDIDEYSEQINEYRRTHQNCKLSNPVNIGSPIQLAILLYDIIGVPVIDKNSPRGTGEAILKEIDLQLCKDILEYRGIGKLLSTYIDKIPNCKDPSDHRVHCKYNQYGAETGRFSSNDPNLQNIPSHNKDIRQMFKATDGYVMMSADFSQQEPKCMTQMCGDKSMIEAYQHGKDLYASIASIAFNRPYEECLEFYLDENGNKTDKTNPEGKEYRSQAKSILLGILYGRGVNSIAEQLHTTKEKAQQIQESVFKNFPAIKKFEQDSLQMAIDKGYVTTLWGRKRRLPDMQLPKYDIAYKNGVSNDIDPLDFEDTSDIMVPDDIIRKYYRLLDRTRFDAKARKNVIDKAESEGLSIIDNTSKIAAATRQCVNSRIQGSAADMSKLAMKLVGKDPQLKEWGFRLLIPVHDELIGECPEENAKKCKERFAYLMSQSPKDKFTIPISCDVAVYKNWYGKEIEL